MIRSARQSQRFVADPSPDEIRRRSEAIRRGWSPRERIRRSTWTPPPWLPPMLEVPRSELGLYPQEEGPSI
jgi:hypothetical protein